MKNQINSAKELSQAIKELERKSAFQKQEIKTHFSGFMEYLKPGNIIKRGLHSAFSGDNKQDLLKAAIGLGSGILGRKLMTGRPGKSSLFRKALGAALEFGIFGVVARNAEKIKEKGSELIEKIFRKRKSNRPGPSHTRSTAPSANYFQKN